MRFDYDVEFTRLYDVNHLKSRILDVATKSGMDYTIYVLDGEPPRLMDKNDTYIYLHFILKLIKK